jgi:hypothetical protein
MADENEMIPIGALSLTEEMVVKTTGEAATIGLHLDIETLDTGPRSVVTQIALYGVDLESQEMLPHPVWSYLPVQPQLDLVKPRTISADTIWWWFQQSDEARAEFEKSLGDDFGSLLVLMKHLTMSFNQMTNKGTANYIIIARGPQFDCVNVESLYRDCGLKAPWDYATLVDLRTLLREAGITKEEERAFPKPPGYIPHQAGWDCRHQSNLYFEARRRLRSR